MWKKLKLLYWNEFRFSEQLGYIKSEKCSESSGEHFTLPGHKSSDIEGMILEQVRNNNPNILRAREELLIQKLDSYIKNRLPFIVKELTGPHDMSNFLSC